MHIEKNVCVSIYGILLHIPGKTKDGLKSINDLVEMKIMDELAPTLKKNKCTFLPAACYTLTRDEKIRFYKALKSIKVPTGYSSNIKNLVSMKNMTAVFLCNNFCLLPFGVSCQIILKKLCPGCVSSLTCYVPMWLMC